jgi:hypothetical protein
MVKVYFNFMQDFDDSYNKYKSQPKPLQYPPHTGDIIKIEGFYHYVVQAVMYPDYEASEVFLAESSQDRATAIQAGLTIINTLKDKCVKDDTGIENYGYHFEELNSTSRVLQSM